MSQELGRRLSLSEAESLVRRALTGVGASETQAAATARALIAAEADGQSGHGLSRVASYAAQVKTGKINGGALPRVLNERPGALLIDVAGGFAYPALELASDRLAGLARHAGSAAAALKSSHHIGQAGRVVEGLAAQGLVALIVSNTPKAMAFWGGRTAALGTNPLAFAAPLPDRAPLVIDLALSQVARSKVVAAKSKGQAIPADWAFDANGQPTTDPDAALKGALAPLGGPKGAALALMVEVLCAALTGSHFGWEASSFLDAEGAGPAVGQVLFALDPEAFSGGDFLPRMGEIMRAAAADGARLPGDRRLDARATAAAEGLRLSEALFNEITALGSQNG